VQKKSPGDWVELTGALAQSPADVHAGDSKA
jgi:hypothetical protein